MTSLQKMCSERQWEEFVVTVSRLFLNAFRNKRKLEEVSLTYALSQRLKWEMCVG